MKEISSTKNERIKRLRALQTKKGREEYRAFAVEGIRALKDLPKGITPSEVYVRKGDEKLLEFALTLHNDPTVVPDFVMDTVCDTVTTAGIIAEFPLPEQQNFQGRKVLVADGVADSGNLGTLIRTGIAMGFTDFLCLETADPYAPKTVRATMGGIFRANVVRATPEEGIRLLDGYEVAALDMAGENVFKYRQPKEKFALAVGGEAHGVSPALLSRANIILSIPMQGEMESLNAAVAASAAMIIIAENSK